MSGWPSYRMARDLAGTVFPVSETVGGGELDCAFAASPGRDNASSTKPTVKVEEGRNPACEAPSNERCRRRAYGA